MKLILLLTAILVSDVFALNEMEEKTTEALYKQWLESAGYNPAKRVGIVEDDRCDTQLGTEDFMLCVQKIRNITVVFQFICIAEGTINDQMFLGNRIVDWEYFGQKGKVRTDEAGFVNVSFNIKKNQDYVTFKWGEVIKKTKILSEPFAVISSQKECSGKKVKDK